MLNSQSESLTQTDDKKANYLTMLGHMCSDINQGAISATLPFLIFHYGYSYFEVTMLVFATNIASAIIQPLFGWIGDKRPTPQFMALGVFLAGLGMFGVGYLSDYWACVASAMVSGIGIAMFHPEGGRLSNLAAGARKGNGMSIFAVGGNVGFFVGPMLTAVFLTAFGMRGTAVFLVPAFVCPAVLLANTKRFKALGTTSGKSGTSTEDLPPEHWGKFAIMLCVLALRSILFYGLMAFIPLFLVNTMGQSEAFSSMAISFFAIAGAFATALSGRTCERMGVHRVVLATFAIGVIVIVAFAFNRSVVAAVILTMLMAVALDIAYPSTVALGMSYVPRHLGTASGMCYGLAVCAGGIAEPFLGSAGDAIGLVPVMLILAGVCATAFVLSCVIAYLDREDAK